MNIVIVRKMVITILFLNNQQYEFELVFSPSLVDQEKPLNSKIYDHFHNKL